MCNKTLHIKDHILTISAPKCDILGVNIQRRMLEPLRKVFSREVVANFNLKPQYLAEVCEYCLFVKHIIGRGVS
jgi:hypothetical protein